MRFEDPPRTDHGVPAPTSTSALRDAWTDIRHGAPRRVIGDALAAFAGSLPPDARVLEVGAGHYDHGRFFADLERLDADPAQHPDHLGDAHAMPLEDASFDAAVAISVLEHVHNPFTVMDELFRVLRPGGALFAWVPFHFAVHAFPTDISRFTEEGLRQCALQSGFVDVRTDVAPYSGVMFNLSNAIHFALPRNAPSRARRIANRALLVPVRAAFVLDRRYRTTNRYAGTELLARKPEVIAPGGATPPG